MGTTAAMQEDKKKALNLAIAQIEKNCGKGAIMKMGAEGAILHAAVHGWYEGHIEGEDVCRGCTFRGDLSQQRQKLMNPDLN